MNIPFHKPYITEDEVDEVVDSIRSGWITMGPKTHRFEEEFSRYIGSRHSVAVNSCTAALHLALKVVGIDRDDEVILPAMTFTSTAEVVTYMGARPVIVDTQRDTHNIDIRGIEKSITRKTKAIIPVHYAGQACDMAEIMRMARKHNLYVIEDAAHSLPAWYNSKTTREEPGGAWQKIGTIGDITCFSFYATKTLATGEGGMVCTANEEWADKLKILRLHGISKDAWKRYTNEGSWHYNVVEAGYKYNMTDIQAALGLAQLKKVKWMWERRKEIAERYTEAFKDSELIISPSVNPEKVSAWHLYVIKLNVEALTIGRDVFIEKLKEQGIGTSVHFIPLYRHPFYRDTFGYRPEDFPDSEWVYERSLSLPIYPGMSDEEVEYVIENVRCLTLKYRR